jgi:hypothetical protein
MIVFKVFEQLYIFDDNNDLNIKDKKSLFIKFS